MSLPCNFCYKTFAKEEHLREHQKRHNDRERKFICSICSEGFMDKSVLVLHVQSMHSDTVFRCTYEGCTKTCKTNSNLLKHIRGVHEKIRPERSVCLVCGKSYAKKSYLKTHIKEQHGDEEKVSEDSMNSGEDDDSLTFDQSKYSHPWEDPKVADKFFDIKENIGIYMNFLRDKYNMKTTESLYNLSPRIFAENYGAFLLNEKYNKSIVDLLEDIYSNETWYPWLFKRCERGTWHQEKHQKRYIYWLGSLLGFKEEKDYYKLDTTFIEAQKGGGSLLAYLDLKLKKDTDSSREYLLKLAFPNYEWYPWMFTIAPQGIWKNMDIRKAYLVWLGGVLEYKTLDDYHKLTHSDIEFNYGSAIRTGYSSIYDILVEIFPEHKWSKAKFVRNGYSVDSIMWLSRISKVVKQPIQHAKNEGEYVIDLNQDKTSKVDGHTKCLSHEEALNVMQMIEDLQEGEKVYRHLTSHEIVFEFHCDFWHGRFSIENNDPSHKCAREKFNSISNKSYAELYDNTIARDEEIKLNYNYVVLWDHEWKAKHKAYKQNKE